MYDSFGYFRCHVLVSEKQAGGIFRGQFLSLKYKLKGICCLDPYPLTILKNTLPFIPIMSYLKE